MNKDTITAHIRMSPELRRKLKTAAASKGMKVSALLEFFLKRKPKSDVTGI